MRLSTLLALSSPLLLAGCVYIDEDGDPNPDPGHDSDLDDVPTDTDDTGDTEEDPEGVHGTVTGTVYLQLYMTDANGDMELLDWDDTYGYYPFGDVFVGAYSEDEDGYQTYYDSSVITEPTVSPAPGGDPYGLDIDADDIDGINIYAIVDYWGDGIMGTNEPVGAYPAEVVVNENGTLTEIDVTVLVPYYDLSSGGGTGEGSSGGGTGEGCTSVGVSGDAIVDTPYLEGDVAVMLYDTANLGPYYYSRITPTPTDDGAEGAFTVSACADSGDMKLFGAWDSNGNDLFDPADRWGEYVTDPDTSGNPITIGSGAMANMDVLIPFGDMSPRVVPFVSLSGTLTSTEDWSSSAAVYIAALKFRPNSEITVEELSEGYDTEMWDNAELLASDALDYHVEVPANTIVYLWAYTDVDGDGILNEPGDPVASLGDSTGRTVTGTTNQPGLDLVLTLIE